MREMFGNSMGGKRGKMAGFNTLDCFLGQEESLRVNWGQASKKVIEAYVSHRGFVDAERGRI